MVDTRACCVAEGTTIEGGTIVPATTTNLSGLLQHDINSGGSEFNQNILTVVIRSQLVSDLMAVVLAITVPLKPPLVPGI